MSKLETNTIDTVSGTTNLTIGSTNSSTVTFESGAATGHMSPAFLAYRATDQSGITDSTLTKVENSTEVFDTDSAYDNSTNYRFTVPTGKAGKYFFYHCVRALDFGSSRLISQLKKNGSSFSHFESENGSATRPSAGGSVVIDLSAGDYIEQFAFQNSGSSRSLKGGSDVFDTYLGGFRIGA